MPSPTSFKKLPTVFQLGSNLFAACFWLMKLGVAFEMLESAVRERRVTRGGLIVETTSGTMGYGLAIAGRSMGMRVQLVGDPAIDPTFKDFLSLLGTEIHIVQEHLPIGGYQIPRLNKLRELQATNPEALWVQQYDNPANPASYREAAQLIAASVDHVDFLVASVGSGGSVSGTVRSLRRLGQTPWTIAVDTHGSILFGQSETSRDLRGLGNSILPKNLDYTLIDEVHWVEASHAFLAMRHLFADHMLDMGPTTGAAFMVAEYIARTNPGHTVVFLGPDRAERYIATAYSTSWCIANGLYESRLPDSPYRIDHPRDAHGGWAMMQWKGCPLSAITRTSS